MSEPTPKPRNPALRMLGLPRLPRKLPSRNWLIFWTLSTTISAAIIYDRREKRRATARWAAAVSHLAKEPLPSHNVMPRKVTVYLEAPPGDGLRVANEHFADYVKPVLASSGLDWEFVVGRREGDVRAAVAEKIRRNRKPLEASTGEAVEADEPTEEDIITAVRKKNGITEFEGVKGDIVIGRHTWKEYIRGQHEGWLGPLAPPPEPESTLEAEPKKDESSEESKPKRPPQPRPYILPADYPSSALPQFVPAELAPSTTISFPHILGFLNTPIRMRRFFTRRYLADQIGREVAAVCFCTYREYKEDSEGYEQQDALVHEERDWIKSVWKEEAPPKASTEATEGEVMKVAQPKERILGSPMVIDPRIAVRMRRFELLSTDEDRARNIVVPEEEIEGWIKRSLRNMGRWGVRKWKGEEIKVNVGDLED